MKIAIDQSPLNKGNYLQHRVRGTGAYINGLREALLKYYPKNDYTFFVRGGKLPDNLDLVHIPYFEPFFLTLPFTKKAKTVVTIHDMTPFVFPDKFPSGLKGKIKWQIQKMNLKRIDAIITDSASSKNDIIKFANIPSSKIHVVYLAADNKYGILNTEYLIQNTKKKFNLPDKFLLYVGDATWNKNLPNLISAINRTNYTLVIVGKAFKEEDFDKSNPWNQSLSEAQSLAKLNKKVIALGFLNSGDLAKIYQAATAFIMPSFYEGFGLPVLEAMTSGVPVITSDKGSLKEVGGNAVYHVDPDSVDSIKDGIDKVMNNNKLREELSKKGLERARKFSWKKTAEETIKVYEEIINKR